MAGPVKRGCSLRVNGDDNDETRHGQTKRLRTIVAREYSSEDFDAEVDTYAPRRVQSTKEAVDHVLEIAREEADCVLQSYTCERFTIADPLVHVALLATKYPCLCVHCGTEHHQIIIQTISARKTRNGHGTSFIQQALDALPAAYALGKGPPLPVGLLLQSAMNKAGVGLATRLGMTLAKSSSFGNGYGDYHLCTHKQ